jgi:threonine dehydratase
MLFNPDWPAYNIIEAAADRIQTFIHRTPVLTSRTLNRKFQCEIYFKCENFQKAGAFKIRGATNAILALNIDQAEKGVATHSSGNHAQAVAMAARIRKIPAYIVMPRNSPEVKKKAVQEYGAHITECDPTLEAREKILETICEETGATFIPPYNDYRIIGGQATAAMELHQDVHDLDYIIAPVGGGGLLSGTALVTYQMSRETSVIGAEPAGADDAYRSVRAGEIIPSENPDTIAEGLLTSLGDKTFPIIKELTEEIITVSDDEIIKAMRLIWERMKIVVEPSAATGLAAIMNQPETFENKRVGIIISGGNVDLDNLPFH